MIYFGSQLEGIQSAMVGMSQREESEAAGHVATQLESGEMNAGDQHIFVFLLSPGPQPTRGIVLPTVRAYLPFSIYQI